MYFNKKVYVGALTDKLYAFKARPWELSIVPTVDILDSMASNIKIFSLGSEIKRILPLKTELINEDWISNRTRYFFEGLSKWRINIPLINKNNLLVYSSWFQSFFYLAIKIWFYSFYYKSKNLIFLKGYFIDYESIITSRYLLRKVGFILYNNDININDFYLYYLNLNFNKDINNKDFFFFLGINLRLESPILNIKLRKKLIKENVLLCSIGSLFNDNLNSINFGLNINNLILFLKGKLRISTTYLKLNKKKSNFIYLLGNNIQKRLDVNNIYKIILSYSKIKNFIKTDIFSILLENKKFLKLENFVNIIPLNLSNILYNELNLKNNLNKINKINENDILYLIGNNYINSYKNKFIIFQGHHFNINRVKLDLILPSTTFLEKSSEYLNIEGILLSTNLVLHSPFFSRNDWSILNALYLFILNFVYKIYKFNNNEKIVNYLKLNRFYISLDNVKKLYFFIKKVSMNFYYKEVSKYFLYNNIKIKDINIKKLNIYYNSIVLNYWYNPYTLDILSFYSTVLSNSRKNFSIKNYMNIKKNYVCV